jgi:hypothetical protein
VVRQVAEAIIDFLAQVEDFQKRLWQKRKFVLRTEYCLTVDRVPEELWDEVLGGWVISPPEQIETLNKPAVSQILFQFAQIQVILKI